MAHLLGWSKLRLRKAGRVKPKLFIKALGARVCYNLNGPGALISRQANRIGDQGAADPDAPMVRFDKKVASPDVV